MPTPSRPGFGTAIPIFLTLTLCGVHTTVVTPSCAAQKGPWKALALSRRTLRFPNPSSQGNSQLGHPLERQSSDSFGEKVLGTSASGGSRGGDWRVPAGRLLKHCRFEGETNIGSVGSETESQAEMEGAVGEARPQEVESFFNELGLDPTPTISTK